jgi:hypothetical protein
MGPDTPPTPPASTSLDPALFSPLDAPLLSDDSAAIGMAIHSQLSAVQSRSHARHQSVPSFPSPQNSPRNQQSSRGLAKLTLVERLSRESISSPTSGDPGSSPKSMSPTRFDEGSPRPSHSPRRNRMSLTIPPTKTATAPINTTPIASPLRQVPPVLPATTQKHVSNGSFGDIVLSPTHVVHERNSPSTSSLEEVAALDDANATFLTLIAFQERRVVELREELARAESELDLLKQQWTRQQLKMTRSARQEHVRQNSITKLEQQMMHGGAIVGAPLDERDDYGKSPQILVAGKRLAEGLRDGFFTVMEDIKAAAANESTQTTPRQRGRSPTRVNRDDVGLGIDTEKRQPPLWIPKSRSSSPTKRSTRRESDGSDTTHDTTSTNTMYVSIHDFSNYSSTRTSSLSSTSSTKSPSLDPSTPTHNRTAEPISPWAWSMASRILNQSQRHATTLFETVEKHLDSLAAGPEPPLHPRRARRLPSGHMRTETVQF